MRRASPTPLLFALTVVFAVRAAAQTSAPSPAPVAETPLKISTPPPAPTPTPTRAVSPETAAKLAAIAPKFVPQKTDDEKSAPPVDKPRNTIIHLPVILLPSYTVQEPKLREFKQRELLTWKAKLELVYKKNPGLHIGSLPFFSNDGIGLFMIEEEERLERMKESEDLLSLLRYTNDDPKGELATKVRQGFIRHD